MWGLACAVESHQGFWPEPPPPTVATPIGAPSSPTIDADAKDVNEPSPSPEEADLTEETPEMDGGTSTADAPSTPSLPPPAADEEADG